MPQDTPTTPITADPNEAPGYFPTDFGAELDAALDNATTVECRRVRPGKARLLVRLKLQLAGSDVHHGGRTDRSVDDIASEIWSYAETDADAECNGHGLYKVSVTYAKPLRGVTAKPVHLELRVGHVADMDEKAQRRELIDYLLGERREMWAQHLALLRVTTEVAGKVGTMANGLATAYSNLHVAQTEVANTTEVRALARTQLEQDAMRFDALRGIMREALPLVRAKLGLPAAAAEDPSLPPMVVAARKLALSMRPDQVKLANELVPALTRIATVEDEAGLLRIVAEVVHASSQLDPLIETLSPEQQHAFEQIVVWASTKAAPQTA